MSPVASTRWCPTTEQIMILEEMYRGGIRTPNATQIQQITSHLSLYGKIEGKNVFYWFQNHKARDRQKLRKRLLGKQLHLHQPQLQKHTIFPNITPTHINNIPDNNNNEVCNNFQPNYHNFLHFDENALLPPPPPHPPLPRYPLPYSPLIGIHQLHNLNSPQGFSPNYHQGRTHSHGWKMDTTETNINGREKSSRPIPKTHDDNWIMLGDHHHHDHHNRYADDHDVDDNDDDHDYHEMECDATRPLKTLQLFPIKEKTSLKEKHNNISSPSHFHAYF